MSSTPTKRTRSDRVATLKLPPGTFEKARKLVRRGDVLTRVGLCCATALLAWLLTGAWVPPFPYRVGDIPARNIVARVTFERVDEQGTIDAQDAARRVIDCVYVHDPRPLRELQLALKDKIFQLLSANSYDDVDKALWSELAAAEDESEQQLLSQADALSAMVAAAAQAGAGPALPATIGTPTSRNWRKRAEFTRFKRAFADDPDLSKFAGAISRSLAEFTDHGLLANLQHDMGQGNQARIRVYPVGNPNYLRPFEVDQVRIGQAAPRLEANLRQQLPSAELAVQVFAWLQPRLPTTLTFDGELTRVRADAEIREMPPVMITFQANETDLARASEPLTPETLALLRDEHQQYVSQLSFSRELCYSASKFGLYLGGFALCGLYIFFRHRGMLNDLVGLGRLLLLVLVTIGVSYYAAPSRSELVPLLLFSMTVVILYRQELALLLSVSVALVTIQSLDYNLVDLVTALAGMSTTVLLLKHVRSRTKLIYVALWTAAVTVTTSIGADVLAGQAPVCSCCARPSGRADAPSWRAS